MHSFYQENENKSNPVLKQSKQIQKTQNTTPSPQKKEPKKPPKILLTLIKWNIHLNFYKIV